VILHPAFVNTAMTEMAVSRVPSAVFDGFNFFDEERM
jgi:hypothetical protein